jgi:hypothetical protein
MSKRVNKTKKEIVKDIKLNKTQIEDAERRRSLVKNIIYPHLVKMNETIAYSKVFLQAFHSLADGVFNDLAKITTIGAIEEGIKAKLEDIFDTNDKVQREEMQKYLDFIEVLKFVPVQDLVYAAELPRYIDGYFTKDKDKAKMETINLKIIEEILG